MEQLAQPSPEDRLRVSDDIGLKQQLIHSQEKDGDANDGVAIDTAIGADETPRGGKTSHLSLDDIEAAQALEELRADSKIDPALRSLDPAPTTQQPEPLLSLLTSQHPLLSTAINVPLSAYTSTKSYSPSFKYSAEFVERHLGSPVINTVGVAGRLSGVETGVRWWLQPRADSSASQRGSKRRRVGNDNNGRAGGGTDIERGLPPGFPVYNDSGSPRLSLGEALPPYDEKSCPSYEQHDSSVQRRNDSSSPKRPTWKSRLVTSTSGLGVAMSNESLRGLKYCLNCLRGANNYIIGVTVALKDLFQELHTSQQGTSEATPPEHHGQVHAPSAPRDQGTIRRHIQALKSHILNAFNEVVGVVSTYTGSSLPENARDLVRSHLMSLPYRFYLASQSDKSVGQDDRQNSSSDPEQSASEREVSSARRVMVLAIQGLDMMSQISSIIDGTITSAEEWLNRLSRKKRERRDSGDGVSLEERKQRQLQGGETDQMVYDDKKGVVSLQDMKTDELVEKMKEMDGA
ncbi:MAG: hypothetical protein Q9179_002502 [Wetmoreana sp. 5 TL-2023]